MSLAPTMHGGLHAEILVAITNYDFNENAARLRHFFASACPTVLIDASSPTPSPEADLLIANEGYRGLWNAAARLAIEGDYQWLMFMASDVQIRCGELFVPAMIEASQDPRLALWTPSLAPDSRHSYRSCTHRPATLVRACGIPEGFCFMVRTEILRRQFPVPSSNRYGYKIDMATAAMARSMGRVVVDDRVIIFHPQTRPEHQIDVVLADRLGDAYLHSLQLDPQLMAETLALEALADQGKPTPGHGPRRCLDLGCGASPRDPFNTGDAWGIDLSALPASPRIRHADLIIEAIPFENQSFDYLCAFDLLSDFPRRLYLPQRRLPLVELMNEIHRVLKPGGLFLSLCRASESSVAGADPTHGHGITDQTLLRGFCTPELLACADGFTGRFLMEHQSRQENGALLTLLRALPAAEPATAAAASNQHG